MVKARQDTPEPAVPLLPAPALVVGIGSYGLEVLYRLSERWKELVDDDGSEPSLRSLALLHLDTGKPEQWQDSESAVRRIAASERIGQSPSWALDLAILRTLGLVRIVDGTFQVAIPCDQGAVELQPQVAGGGLSDGSLAHRTSSEGVIECQTTAASAESGSSNQRLSDPELQHLTNSLRQYLGPEAMPQDFKMDSGDELGGLLARHRVFRKRYYEWVDLAVDPAEAAERLQRSIASDGDLARFVNPLLVRVRVGNSPAILLDVIRQVRCWQQGRMPSPWRRTPVAERVNTTTVSHYAELLGLPESPVVGGELGRELEIWRRQASDPHCPIEPWVLLCLDWESPGWTFSFSSDARNVYRTLPASPDRFGFFDLDRRVAEIETASSDERACQAEQLRFNLNEWNKHLGARIRSVGADAWSGLVRLWGEMNRRRKVTDEGFATGPVHEDVDDMTLRQSLELLSVHVIQPLISDRDPSDPGAPTALREHYCDGSEVWEQAINRLIPTDAGTVQRTIDAFERRLQTLGVKVGEVASGYQIFERVRLGPEAVDDLGEVIERPLVTAEAAAANDLASHAPTASTRSGRDEEVVIRAWLNRQLKRMLRVQERGGRESTLSDPPPYVRIYVVGDLGEACTRVVSVAILRWLQAEALRSVRPMFQGRFDGFTRPIAIVPVFSMPHPADSSALHTPPPEESQDSQGSSPQDKGARRSLEQRIVHERVMLMAVHRLRRSLEIVPAQERLVFELFVNSRVTDRAVLDRDMSFREMVSFLWLCVRNTLPAIEELNRLTRNVNSDVLATFSCRELRYEESVVRSWMSLGHSRLMVREFLGLPEDSARLNSGDTSGLTVPDALKYPVRDLSRITDNSEDNPLQIAEESARRAQRALRDKIEKAASNVNAECTGLESLVTRESEPADLLRQGLSAKAMEELVDRHVKGNWGSWEASKGLMDQQFEELSKATSQYGAVDADAYRKSVDDVVGLKGPERGLRVIHAYLQRLHKLALEHHHEAARRVAEVAESVAGRVPPEVQERVKGPQSGVRDALLAMPSWTGMRTGAWVAGVVTALAGPAMLGAAVVRAGLWLPWWFALYVLPVGFGAAAYLLATRWLGGEWDAAKKRVKVSLEALGAAAASIYQGGTTRMAAGDLASTDVLAYFEGRVRHTWAVFGRHRARSVAVLAAGDLTAVRRLQKACEERLRQMERRAEALGVTLDHEKPTPEHDGLDRLWVSQREVLPAQVPSQLVGSSVIIDWFSRTLVRSVSSNLKRFLKQEKVYTHWRELVPFDHASLADFHADEAVMGTSGSRLLDDIERRREARLQLRKFQEFHLRTLGYAAQFRGFEGFDEDGIDESGMKLLVPDYALGTLVGMGDEQGADILEVSINNSSLYLFMTALGIQERSFQNLRSFDTVHDVGHHELRGVFGVSDMVEDSAQRSLQQFSHSELGGIPFSTDGER